MTTWRTTINQVDLFVRPRQRCRGSIHSTLSDDWAIQKFSKSTIHSLDGAMELREVWINPNTGCFC